MRVVVCAFDSIVYCFSPAQASIRFLPAINAPLQQMRLYLTRSFLTHWITKPKDM